MEMIPFFCVLVAVSTAARMSTITDHPHSIEVTEGMWANFTCAIKVLGHIKWRIGDLITREGNIFNFADDLPALEGVTSERLFPSVLTNNNILTETIGVLATADMDGTAVQCMLQHPANPSKDKYSKFALLNVNTTHTTSGSTSTLYPDDIDGKT